MNRRDGFTKALAVIGTGLLALPLAAPLFFGVMGLVVRGQFRLDYLMPAELFPVAALGGGLLLWAAFRARARRGLIGGSLATGAAALVAGQALAVVTGLASGVTRPAGWPLALVVGALGVYAAGLAAGVVGGGLLLRELYAPPGSAVGRPPDGPADRRV